MIGRCGDIAAFVAGELDDDVACDVRVHLAICANCESELEQILLEETVTHPAGRGAALLSAGGLERAACGLLSSDAPRKQRRISSMGLAVLAAAAVTLIVNHGRVTRPSEPLRERTGSIGVGVILSVALPSPAHDQHASQPAACAGILGWLVHGMNPAAGQCWRNRIGSEVERVGSEVVPARKKKRPRVKPAAEPYDPDKQVPVLEDWVPSNPRDPWPPPD